MTDLDALDLDRLDPAGMLATVERSGAMWREALAAPDAGAASLSSPTDPRGIVVAGMGGSGIAGDVATLAAERAGRLPVTVVKGYTLPRWVTPDHLVIAVSHSGNTEETLTAVEEAAHRGCTIAAVTSGGTLGALASEHRWWSARIPEGNQPRASLPYLIIPVLRLLVAVGALPGSALDDVDDLPRRIDDAVARWGHAVPARTNLAKRTATALAGRVPVFYGGRGVGALVALRAKCQVNENAARPAFHHELPERDHNEVVGWDPVPDPFSLVAIRSPEDEPSGVRRRFDAADVELGVEAWSLPLEAPTWLMRLAEGILLVDLVSVYLAFLHGVDPTPVEPIERLKRRIATEGSRA